MRPFSAQKDDLPCGAASVAPGRPVGTNHAIARHALRIRIVMHDVPHRAICIRPTCGTRDLLVRHRLPARNPCNDGIDPGGECRKRMPALLKIQSVHPHNGSIIPSPRTPRRTPICVYVAIVNQIYLYHLGKIYLVPSSTRIFVLLFLSISRNPETTGI